MVGGVLGTGRIKVAGLYEMGVLVKSRECLIKEIEALRTRVSELENKDHYESRNGAERITGDIGEEERSDEVLQEQDLKKSLEEKTILIKEIQHHVKNNMQVILSLVRMKGYQIRNPEVLETLRDIESRVMTMALSNKTG